MLVQSAFIVEPCKFDISNAMSWDCLFTNCTISRIVETQLTPLPHQTTVQTYSNYSTTTPKNYQNTTYFNCCYHQHATTWLIPTPHHSLLFLLILPGTTLRKDSSNIDRIILLQHNPTFYTIILRKPVPTWPTTQPTNTYPLSTTSSGVIRTRLVSVHRLANLLQRRSGKA